VHQQNTIFQNLKNVKTIGTGVAKYIRQPKIAPADLFRTIVAEQGRYIRGPLSVKIAPISVQRRQNQRFYSFLWSVTTRHNKLFAFFSNNIPF